MSERIHCIDGDITRNDDGTLDCIWLAPFWGDVPPEQREDIATLGLRRGCYYCMLMLEWRTRMGEEGWKHGAFIGHGDHTDWPGELSCVEEVLDSEGKLIGYEIQWKLYKSLHEARFYGWELQFDYYHDGKKRYEEETPVSFGCSDNKCPACCNGICCKDTTPLEKLDQYASSCNFIKYSDNWLLWKYGVEYKDFECRNCGYFKSINTYGHCSECNDERYEGGKACQKFIKRGSDAMPKQTYWTKCGIEFQKSTNADVTGYELKLLPSAKDPLKVKSDIEHVECRTCPFVRIVEEGYPDPIFKRFECRAGSKAPNHKTEWTGSLEDKNTINIHSLDHQLMEEILQFCKNHPDLGAGYNADHMADCRRTISVSCSSNKKGIAAKKELIDKFFPVTPVAPDKPIKKHHCGNCDYGHWFSSENTYTSVVSDDGIHTTKRPCNVYTHYCYQVSEDGQKKIAVDKDFDPNTSPEWCPLEKSILANQPATPNDQPDESCNDSMEACDKYECPFNDYAGGCCFSDENPESEDYHQDVVGAVNEYNCQREEVNLAYKIIMDLDSCDTESCEPEDEISENVIKTLETVNETAISANDSSKPVIFDYSAVDEKTAQYLREKAFRIAEISGKAKTLIGKELKEAQDELSKRGYGCFEEWYTAGGYSKTQVYRLINRYDFVCSNLEQASELEQLPDSLMYEISKPSAPTEVVQKVLDGGVKTHKDYKALEARLKESEQIREQVQKKLIDAKFEAERETKKQLDNSQRSINALNKTIHDKQQQLDQAKRNGDPAKVQELGKVISEKQEEIDNYQQQIGSLNQQLQMAKQQLHDQPIEVSATREVIPDEVKDLIYKKVLLAIEAIKFLTDREVDIFTEGVDSDEVQDIMNTIDASMSRLRKIKLKVFDLVGGANP
jgi:hypothetical protein